MSKTILEDKKGELISQAKQGANYKDTSKGKNRYERRTKSKLASSVKHFNSIDMDKLFKSDILDVNIDVTGETSTYVVRISFSGFLDELHNFMATRKLTDVDRKTIAQALSRAFNNYDVYFNCTCPDFCLHPDTKIKLLSGESIAVSEMKTRFENGETLWVYSTNDRGDFRPGKVSNVWVSQHTNRFIQVTLDTGEKILTTPTHPYMKRDGSYCNAEKLQAGDSLMPLYFSYHNGYEAVKINSQVYPTEFKSVYKLVSEYLLQNEIEDAKIRSGEDIIAIHHRDFNKNNNTPENLYPMGKNEHWMYHASHIKDSGVLEKFISAGQARNQRIKNRETDEYEFQAEIMRNAITDYYSNRTSEQIKKDSKVRSAVSKQLWADPNSKVHQENWHNAAVQRGKNLHTLENEAKTRTGVINYYSNLTPAQKSADVFKRNISKITNIINSILLDNKIPSEKLYEEYRTNGYPKYTKVFNTWEELSTYFGLNHKVVAVELIELDSNVPVYDINVDDWHNFLLDAGVMVHNCYRHAYNATQNDNLIGDPEARPIRRDVFHVGGLSAANYDGSRGPICKHITLALKDTSWLIRVASVIFNYINYMKDHYERDYQKHIYPAIYQEPYPDEEVQLDLTDLEVEPTETEEGIDLSEYQEIVDDDLVNNNGRLSTTTRALIDDAGLSLQKQADGSFIVRGNRLANTKSTVRKQELDKVNDIAREKGKFKSGNEFRFKKNTNPDDDQQRIDIDNLFGEE